jgi:hypothetical protein
VFKCIAIVFCGLQPDGTTPVIAALQAGHWELATMLLTHIRVDPNYFKPPRFPPLLECCQNGWLEALELLLSMPRVDVNFQLVRCC